MKRIHLLLLLVALQFAAGAQSKLTFDKRFIECEDKWVVHTPENGVYSFGFIYIDAQAGLTMQHGGSFKLDHTGMPVKMEDGGDKYSIKARLQNNDVTVALLPSSWFTALKIEETPDWLKYYKTDTGSVQRLYKWGYMYNEWELYDKALGYLERAYRADSTFKKLKPELAFSYNALGKYEKSIPLLQNLIEQEPSDCYSFKELSYAQQHLNLFTEAEETYRKSLVACKDRSMKGEMAYNLAFRYYGLKDTDKFNYWDKEARKWIKENDLYDKQLKKMELTFLQGKVDG